MLELSYGMLVPFSDSDSANAGWLAALKPIVLRATWDREPPATA